MQRLLFLLAIVYIKSTLISWAQLQENEPVEEYNNLAFVYIDNSYTPGVGGLHGSLINILSDTLNYILQEDSTKIWIYVSDGVTPEVTDQPESFTPMINQLYTRNTEYPNNKFIENRRISSELYQKCFKIQEKMTFHFFITDRMAQTIVDDIPWVMGLLPKDILLDYGTPDTETVVYLYFKNKDKDINDEEVLKSLKFSSKSIHGSKSPHVAYQITN